MQEKEKELFKRNAQKARALRRIDKILRSTPDWCSDTLNEIAYIMTEWADYPSYDSDASDASDD